MKTDSRLGSKKSILGIHKCESCGRVKPAHIVRFRCGRWTAVCEHCIEEGVRQTTNRTEDQEKAGKRMADTQGEKYEINH